MVQIAYKLTRAGSDGQLSTSPLSDSAKRRDAAPELWI